MSWKSFVVFFKVFTTVERLGDAERGFRLENVLRFEFPFSDSQLPICQEAHERFLCCVCLRCDCPLSLFLGQGTSVISQQHNGNKGKPNPTFKGSCCTSPDMGHGMMLTDTKTLIFASANGRNDNMKLHETPLKR